MGQAGDLALQRHGAGGVVRQVRRLASAARLVARVCAQAGTAAANRDRRRGRLSGLRLLLSLLLRVALQAGGPSCRGTSLAGFAVFH